MSALDGRSVVFRDDPAWRGMVLGDSSIPGYVRVQWGRPSRFIGIHRITDLDKEAE